MTIWALTPTATQYVGHVTMPHPCTCLLKPQPHDGCLFQVLLTEPALSAKLSREKTAEVFFEHLSVPALYFSPQVGVPQWLVSGWGWGRTANC